MIRLLHTMYRNAPKPLRQVIVAVSPAARVVLWPLLSRVDIGGATMFLNPRDNASFRYKKWGRDYERVTVSALRELSAGPGRKFFFDCGAAYGFYTLALVAGDREGKIGRAYAFEPDARCVEALQKSVSFNQLDGRIAVARAILGDTEGTADLLVSNRASTSNRSFQTEEGAFKIARSVQVPATTVDATFSPPAGDYIAIFKIDVEGNEARVLRGAAKTLAHAKGWAIQFEFFPVGMAEVHQSHEDLAAILRALAPEWVAVERENGMERLDGMEGLLADMATHADHPDHRGIGTAANYIIGKGVPPIHAMLPQ